MAMANTRVSSICSGMSAKRSISTSTLQFYVPFSKSQLPLSSWNQNSCNFSSISIPRTLNFSPKSVPVRSVASSVEAVAGFDEMAAGTKRKYYMLGRKGGVGKTSCAASLVVKFANHGHPTIAVSTDPAHSLSDSFAQDLTGGMLVPVDGLDSPLFALELINPEKAREEFRSASEKSGGTGVKDFMDSMGLGTLVEQLRKKIA